MAADLEVLVRAAPPTALIAASVFVAYLLGAASQDLTAAMVKRATSLARAIAHSMRPGSDPPKPRRTLKARCAVALALWLRAYASHTLRSWAGHGAAILSRRGERAVERICERQVRKVNGILERKGITWQEVWDEVEQSWWLARGDPRYMILTIAQASAPGATHVDADDPEPGELIAREVISDLDIIKDRLASNASQRHATIDQIEAESDIRLAIVAPLMMLTGVLAVRSSGWWLPALLAPALFWHQGIGRRKQRGDEIVDALESGLTTAPYLDQLMSAAEELAAHIKPETWRERVLRKPRRT